MREGFILLRRGLAEHVADGRMSPLDLAVYIELLFQADPSTGIAKTNTVRLAYEMNVSPRVIRRHLERLSATTSKREPYIKRFATQRSRLPYPVLINRYLCTRGAHTDMYLNAALSEKNKPPVYEVGPREGRTPRPTADQPVRNKSSLSKYKHERKNPPAAETAASAPSPRPSSGLTEAEQRRRIEARDQRLDKETRARADAYVGEGPPTPALTSTEWEKILAKYEMHEDAEFIGDVRCNHCPAHFQPSRAWMHRHTFECPGRVRQGAQKVS